MSNRFPPLHLAIALLLVATQMWAVPFCSAQNPITLKIHSGPRQSLDPRIFGHFLERTSSEIGPEIAVIPESSHLRDDVTEILDAMNLRFIRFPGGAAVEFGDEWTHLIDNAPGREPAIRDEGFRYGFHEYLDFTRQRNIDSLFVVAMGRGLMPWKESSTQRTVEMAAAQVAYFNAPLQNDLPDHLKIWPELRAKNGHPEPFHIRHWQLGNENMIAVAQTLKNLEKSETEIADTYLTLVRKHLDAMRAVDPNIIIFLEIEIADKLPSVPLFDRLIAEFGDEVQYLTQHLYRPWQVREILKHDAPFDLRTFTVEDFARAFSTAPDIDPETGLSFVTFPHKTAAKASGIPLAVTEWNINHWYSGDEFTAHGVPKEALPNSHWARGLAVASFLHAFMREADFIKIANQSMLISMRWAIGAIHIDPESPETPLWRPSGQVTGLYSNHHGHAVLPVEIVQMDYFHQPFRMYHLRASEKAAVVDPVATLGEDGLYLHLLNRDVENRRIVEIDLSDLAELLPTFDSLQHIELWDEIRDESHPENPTRSATLQVQPLELETVYRPDTKLLTVHLRPGSVNIFHWATNHYAP